MLALGIRARWRDAWLFGFLPFALKLLLILGAGTRAWCAGLGFAAGSCAEGLLIRLVLQRGSNSKPKVFLFLGPG